MKRLKREPIKSAIINNRISSDDANGFVSPKTLKIVTLINALQ